ncbi:MAG: hydroxymethylbilane synthase [Sphingobacteriales bacterium]|nr:hydroxymethylbilane synthase [Sphingobacteriales bacterium]
MSFQHLSFEKMEGKGFFTKELEESLLKEEIDVAVHSYKDLPTQQPEGLCIAANSYRENPCDCLLIRRDALDSTAFWQLKAGAIVGTSSPRRTALLQHFRPDVQIQSLRGNVPTRISKLEAGYDAVLLAAAGLERLQLDTSAYQVLHLPPQRFVPAPAQGVLALQTRSHDTELRQILAHIHCPDIAETTAVERHLLQLLEGGCREPMGAYCTKHQNTYQVWVAFSEKNAPLRRALVEEQSVEAVAASVWNIFKNPRRLRVFISREVDDTGYFAQQMRAQQHQLAAQSLVTFRALLAAEMPACDWVFFTSSKGVEFFAAQTKNTTLPPTLKWAALGAGTAATLRRTLHIEADFCGNGNAADAAPLFEKKR